MVSKILIFRSNTKLLSRSELKFREYLLVSSQQKEEKIEGNFRSWQKFYIEVTFYSSVSPLWWRGYLVTEIHFFCNFNKQLANNGNSIQFAFLLCGFFLHQILHFHWKLRLCILYTLRRREQETSNFTFPRISK